MIDQPVAEIRASQPGDRALIAFILLAVGALSIAFSVIAPLLGPISAKLGGEAVATGIATAIVGLTAVAFLMTRPRMTPSPALP
jgi:hypothetical protein